MIEKLLEHNSVHNEITSRGVITFIVIEKITWTEIGTDEISELQLALILSFH